MDRQAAYRAPAVATQEATDGDSNKFPRKPSNAAPVAIRKPADAGNGYRKGLIASVKIAQKDLGLEDEIYRSLLMAVIGKDSAAKCNVGELLAMLGELRKKGWQPKPRIAPELKPLHGKIKALLASLGRPRIYAETIIKRQTNNGATLGTANRAQLVACVAALTRQQRRETAERVAGETGKPLCRGFARKDARESIPRRTCFAAGDTFKRQLPEEA